MSFTSLQWGSSGFAPERDVAALLHAMRRSQGAGDRTEFSQKQVGVAMKAITGRSCNKNKASCLTKALMAMRLIERVGGYVPGTRGIVYKVAPPLQPFTAAA